MMRHRAATLGQILGLLLTGLSSIASAATVTARFESVHPGLTVEYSVNDGRNYSSTEAGEFNWSRTGGTQLGNPTGQFVTLCIELTQYIQYNGIYTYDVVNLQDAPNPGGSGVGNGMGLPKANLIRELWGRYFSQVTNNETAAAFQLAVWEIAYDEGLDLNGGSFRARLPGGMAPDAITTARNWLGSLDGTGPRPVVMAMSSPCYQDQIFYQGPPDSPPGVPAPAAAWCGLGLLGAICLRKYRRLRGA